MSKKPPALLSYPTPPSLAAGMIMIGSYLVLGIGIAVTAAPEINWPLVVVEAIAGLALILGGFYRHERIYSAYLRERDHADDAAD